jgi:hypothetical protein
VLYRLPKLQFLDASAPSHAERAEAAEKGQYMAVRKPKRAPSGSNILGGESPSGLASPSIFSGFGAATSETATSGSGGAAGASSADVGSAGGEADSSSRKSHGAHIMLSTATSSYDGKHSEGMHWHWQYTMSISPPLYAATDTAPLHNIIRR